MDHYDVENIQGYDTVEGDDILQVLMASSRSRADRRPCIGLAMDKGDQLPNIAAERDEDDVVPARWSLDKHEELMREALRRDKVAEEALNKILRQAHERCYSG